MRILGLAGSLRGALTPEQAALLVAELPLLSDREAMAVWLRGLSAPGDASTGTVPDGLREALRTAGARGVSNSEAALAAGLWAAADVGAGMGVDVGFRSLAWHFRPDGTRQDMDALKADLLAADALLVSGPVYFGDRGSLVQELVTLLREDDYLREALAGCLYGGIAVGAKRNGGQETALVYQVLDMVSLGLLAVGNDSETTAQYGGTVRAGMVGSACEDDYGLDTAMGTGRRLARLLMGMEVGGHIAGPVRVAFVILQDARGRGLEAARGLAEAFADEVESEIIDVTGMRLMRCRACDVCPSTIGPDEDYRCALAGRDDFSDLHRRLLDHDALVPVMVSAREQSVVHSAYQVFMERTRYLRRGDYALSDTLLAPMALVEPGADENLHVRAITSLIRHHMVVGRPVTVMLRQGELTESGADVLARWFTCVVRRARLTGAARLAVASRLEGVVSYNPVGYVLPSAANGKAEMDARRRAVEERCERLRTLARTRLAGGDA
ncbi:multimeric flavodoxin WrbA [Desulfobaculum xiamenense]|uniref:Multimeric flavodoxin WrbA n=1 Tax=Desulfobaculum xiamenense TaxID=995050 RepID=A0A846QRP7_9BACT|nr:hypothetical protein [Desulfobaculum xiamenense]NJB69192.1 multimeric flavodoxin WrbA [Desulfobaculum xiamenense]